MKFFVGLDRPSDAHKFENAFISVNRLRTRKRPFKANNWIMDSGAFSTIRDHGEYPHSVNEYAVQIAAWKDNGSLLAAVAQDYMCEPFILKKYKKTVEEHQLKTVKRYKDLILINPGVYIMPVLQGWVTTDYLEHIDLYGSFLGFGQWVGVGSVCKRNTHPSDIYEILHAIKSERPDLNLHGFGLKLTALKKKEIRDLLMSADSMSWSLAARYDGKGHGWENADSFRKTIEEYQTRDEART